MKSVQDTGMTHDSSMRRSFECVVQRSVGDFRMIILQEYFPLQKINSVPNGNMAFVRTGNRNVGIAAEWKKESHENTAYGRNSVHEVAKLLGATKGETGYGNWGKWGKRARMRVLTEASLIVPESETDKNTVISVRSLFGYNYAALQEIKRRYDPEVLFSNWFVVLPSEAAAKAML